MTADTLVSKFLPLLKSELADWRDSSIAATRNPAKRFEFRTAFHTFDGEAETLLRCAIDLISAEFGKINVNDLLGFLADRTTLRATEQSGKLAIKIAPQLQAVFSSRKDEIISNAGPFIAREAVKISFPWFLDAIPTFLRKTLDWVSAEFGNLDVDDLMTFLAKR